MLVYRVRRDYRQFGNLVIGAFVSEFDIDHEAIVVSELPHIGFHRMCNCDHRSVTNR